MVGIAIVNYKSYQKTIECVDSVRQTTKSPYKIYVLENGSGNESAEKLKSKYLDSEDVELIISEENLGYAKGNNVCINHMRTDGCKYGVVSNNDIICRKHSIDVLIEDLREHSDYLLVGPMIVDPKGKYQKSVKIKKYRKAEYIIKSTYMSNLYKKALQEEYIKTKSLSNFTQVSWVSGAFFAFSIENMEKINNFDPTTFLFFEEYILSDKAKKVGLKLGYDPTVEVVHYHAFSTGGGVNVGSKIAADRSERYYFQEYTNNGVIFLGILKIIRALEVLFTLGKKGDIRSIKKYFLEVKVPLK